MTVEERAKTVTDEVGTATTGAELRALIAQALRDQIEECAKAGDQESKRLMVLAKAHTEKGKSGEAFRFHASGITADVIARNIRALAAPTEEVKEKGD